VIRLVRCQFEQHGLLPLRFGGGFHGLLVCVRLIRRCFRLESQRYVRWC
jgi:hypothetical protein